MHKDHLRNKGLCNLWDLFDIIFCPSVDLLVVFGHFIWIFTQDLILAFMGIEGQEEKEKKMVVHCPGKKKFKKSVMKNNKSLSTAHKLWYHTVQLSGLFYSHTLTHLMRKRDWTSRHTLHLHKFTAAGTKGWRGKASQLVACTGRCSRRDKGWTVCSLALLTCLNCRLSLPG